MKKIIAIILAFFCVLCSCQKFETEEFNNDMVEITVSTSVVSGNILTKSFTNEVIDNLPYEYPTKITFYGTGLTYELDLTSTNKISLPKGSYSVQAYAGKFDECSIKSQNCVPLVAGYGKLMKGGEEIPFVTSIDITESKEYNINLYIAGFVVACPKNEVSYFKWENYSGNNDMGKRLENTGLLETTNYYYYILALSTTCLNMGASTFTRFGVEMGETEKNQKTYKSMRVSGGGDNNVLGKYYIFSPDENDFKEFSFSVGGWESGN